MVHFNLSDVEPSVGFNVVDEQVQKNIRNHKVTLHVMSSASCTAETIRTIICRLNDAISTADYI
jgi:hypothetical protein